MRIAPLMLLLALCSCSAGETSLGQGSAALSDAQCDTFQENGKVTICHATGSATNPFRIIRIALDACLNAHSEHEGDHIAVDGDCGPGACLARNAPCDETLPCCDGTTCSDGTCTPITQTEFAWEVSVDGGATWSPTGLPDAEWGCDWCQRQYRTFVTGAPSDVTLRFGSDNQARLLINGDLTSIDYFSNGFWCTQDTCCAQCCDNFTNCTNVVNGQTPISLGAGELALFDEPVNEVRWIVNEEFGGEGFHTVMSVTY
jgi:hypothetical protein